MSWWGKLFGGTFGYMLGGPLGALIGAALGHNLDARWRKMTGGEGAAADRERIQMAFFTATFSVMGHLAKADGRVSEDEIRLARVVMEEMQLNAPLKRLAQQLFMQGKQPGFVLDKVLDQFKRECHYRHTLMRVFVEILMQSAYADGVLHPAEKEILLHICEYLGFSRAEFDQIEALVRAGGYYRHYRGAHAPAREAGMDLSQAYEILNIPHSADDGEVKKAYRRLMNQHHPDKLVAKGLPEEMMKLAAQKTHEIRTAYEAIRKSRGL